MLLVSPPEELEDVGPLGPNLDIYHSKMMNSLRKIKSTYNPRGRITDKELWIWMPPDQRRLADIVMEYEQSIARLFNLDEIGLPGWDDLEAWIEKADQIHRQRMHYCRDLASICGQDIEDTVHMKDLRVRYLESPAHKMMMRSYGPRWQTNLAGILRSYNASSTSLSKLIPLEKCYELTNFRTAKILRSWERLKHRKRDGILDEFTKMWSQLDHSARSSWLSMRAGVWDLPHQDVYTWATGGQSSLRHLGSNLFLTSILNVEDLARPGQLAEFLDARTNLCPQLFRESDSRSVAFGLYSEALPVLRCEGRMTFSNRKLDDQSYEVEVAESTDVNWSGLDPCNGLLSLEAQIRIYNFCLSCTPDQLPQPVRRARLPSQQEEQPFDTLLDRCYNTFHESPDTINLRQIQSLLQASLDEAHDDLWQLRTDEDSWLQRMRETKAESCASNLLTSVSSRIDIFTALCSVLDVSLATLNPSSEGLIRLRLTDHNEIDTVISLEASLLAAQNEILSSIGHIRRSRWNNNTALGNLLEGLMADSSLIRIMGLPRALRVIDREMRAQQDVSYPTALVHTINDLAVLAFSLNQVENHYLFTPPNWAGHFQKLDKLDDAWRLRSRPWYSLIKMTLDGINSETKRKLDVLGTRDTIALEERHFQFWTTIDQRTESVAGQIDQLGSLLKILRRSRLTRPNAENDNLSHVPIALPDPEPTRTAKQRGKRRAQSIAFLPDGNPLATAPTLTPADPDPVDHRPVIPVPMGLRKAWTFWHDLLTGGASSPKEFSWQDFVSSMAAIGYAHETTTGSVYRFEYIHTAQRHAINFHRPHGNGVLNAKQARCQWRDRILRRIRLELVED